MIRRVLVPLEGVPSCRGGPSIGRASPRRRVRSAPQEEGLAVRFEEARKGLEPTKEAGSRVSQRWER